MLDVSAGKAVNYERHAANKMEHEWGNRHIVLKVGAGRGRAVCSANKE